MKDDIHGTIQDAYLRSSEYCRNLVESNPASVAFVTVDEKNCFKQMFFAFGGEIVPTNYASMLSGLASCTPLLVVDGIHNKNDDRGVLLVSASMDAKGRIFLLAFGVVENCLWFHREMWNVVEQFPKVTIISDRQKGMLLTMAFYFLGLGKGDLRHIYCLRHIKVNMKLMVKKISLSTFLYPAATEPVVANFEDILDEIMEISRADTDLGGKFSFHI